MATSPIWGRNVLWVYDFPLPFSDSCTLDVHSDHSFVSLLLCPPQFNWYTRRAVLTGIYNTTELVMMQDSSPDFEDTWRFLENRVADAMTMSNTASQVTLGTSVHAANPFSPRIYVGTPGFSIMQIPHLLRDALVAVSSKSINDYVFFSKMTCRCPLCQTVPMVRRHPRKALPCVLSAAVTCLRCCQQIRLLCIPSVCLGATSATAGSKRSCSPCVSQVQSTGEAVVQGLMGAAVTVSNAETSWAVRELLLNVSIRFPPKSRGQHGKTIVFHYLDLFKGDFLGSLALVHCFVVK